MELSICVRCNSEKNVDEFVQDSSRTLGRKQYCKHCHSTYAQQYRAENQEHIKEINHIWVAANKDKIKQYRLNKYNLSSAEYDQLLLDQEDSCAICGEFFGEDKICVDHDHLCCSGQKSCGNCIRGLLCDRCNIALGKFNDDIANLYSAIKYLEGGYVYRSPR